MKQCMRCGNILKDEAVMCPKCRTMVAQPPHVPEASTASAQSQQQPVYTAPQPQQPPVYGAPQPQQPPVYGAPQPPYGQPGYPQPQYTQPVYPPPQYTQPTYPQQPPANGVTNAPYGQQGYPQQPMTPPAYPTYGAPAGNPYYPPYAPVAPVTVKTGPQLISSLSSRLMVNGIIWLVLGALQILVGLNWNMWWTIVVGGLNIFGGIKDIKRSNEIKTDPRGIIADHESLTGPIVTMIYNILVGGVIGVAGSIYYFAGIRAFVKRYEPQFLAMEQYAYNNY